MLGTALLLSLTPTMALTASSPPVMATRLIYVPGVYAPQCPSDADLRARVVQNLGLDPFVEPAERTAIVVVEGESSAAGDRVTRASVELVDADYQTLGSRSIEGDERCEELVAAAALALAIALDPTRALAPQPHPLPLPLLRPPRLLVRDAPPPVDPLSGLLPEGTRLAFGLGGQGGALLTPGLQAGTHLGVAWRGGWWGLGTELRTDVPAGLPTGAALVSLLPCAHASVVELRPGDALGIKGCATATAGAAWTLSSPGVGGPYLGVGARGGAEWVMQDASAIGIWAQLEWAFLRPAFGAGVFPLPLGGSPVNVVVGATFELGWPQ